MTQKVTYNRNKVEKKKGIFKKISTLLGWGIISIVIIFTILLILLQFRVFRNFVIERVLSIVNNSLIANIELDDLRFNPFGDLKISGLRILTDGDTLVSVNNLDVDIDYWKILQNQLLVRRITISEPKIKFLRSPIDSLWNFEKIAPPTDDTTESEKPQWIISVNEFKIENGSFILHDPLDLSEYKSKIIYNSLDIDDLNFEIAAVLNFINDSYTINLNYLKLKEKNSLFRIDNLKFYATAFKNNLNIENFYFKQGIFDLNLNLSLNDFNLFSPDFEKSSFNLDLSFNQFDFDIFNNFFEFGLELPIVDRFFINISGYPNEIVINKLNCQVGNSEIQLNGITRNIFEIDIFRYEVKDAQIVLYEEEIQTLKKLIGDFPDITRLRFNGSLNGGIDDISANFNLTSSVGSLQGKISIQGFANEITYSGELAINNLNIKPLLNDVFFDSSINGNLSFSVSGDNLENLLFRIDANFNNSFVFNRIVKNSAIKLNSLKFGQFLIDTIYVNFFNFPTAEDNWLIRDETEYFALSGVIDISNLTKPEYSISGKFESLNLGKIFDHKDLPNSLSGSLFLEGSGFHIDSLNTRIVLDMYQSVFQDRFLLPFSVDLLFKHESDDNRTFQVNSDFIDAFIEGNFSYSKLLPTLANQVDYLVDYIENKLYAVNPEFVAPRSDNRNIEKVSEFPESDFQLDAEIKNLANFSFLLEDIDLFINAKVKLNYSSDKHNSELKIEEINLNNLSIKSKDFFYNTNHLSISGLFSFTISDSVASLKDLDLKVSSNSSMIINDLKFLNPFVNVQFAGENANLKFSTTMNDHIYYSAQGNINFGQDEIQIRFDSLTFAYGKLMWKCEDEIVAIYSDDGLTLKKFNFIREKAEKINVTGTFRNELFEDINITISGFPLQDIYLFVDDQTINSLPNFKGEIELIKINLNGTANEPIVRTNLQTDGFELNSFQLGKLKVILNHQYGVISGELSLESLERLKKEIIKINIVSLPLDLSLSLEGDRFHNREQLYIYCRLIEIPMEILQSFIPDLEELTGEAIGELTISGFTPDKIKYDGNLIIKDASFILSANNLKYNASGSVRIKTDQILIDKLEIRNTPEDLRNGYGTIIGLVNHKDFNPSYFDFKISVPRLMLLNDASIKSMPTLYGKFIISTGSNQLRFWGTFSEPNLDGDVSILRADLKMPDELVTRTTRSAMSYEIKERFSRISNENADILQNVVPSRDFADLINYDLSIKFAGQFVLTMSISGSQLIAYIGTQDRDIPIRYVKLRDETEPRLFGEINVKEGSMLKLYKVFSTSGNVYFPTGSVIDPGLNLIAEYTGKTFVGGSSRTYLVRLNLTGTKNRPNMRFSYFIDGVEQTGDSTTINENALFLLMTGKTKQQLFESGSAESDIFRETFTSLLSTETSKALTDLLSGTEVIQSADINFEGGDFQTARLKLTGRLVGDISWELGGTVADFANNNTFSIDVPLASLLNTNLLNMNVQVSTTTNFSTTNSIDQKNWEIKIKVGGNW